MTTTEKKSGSHPRLRVEVLEHGHSLGSHITNGEDRLIVGSSKRADVILPDQDVSHIHAMLRLVDDQIYVYDLGSSQGTFVAGKKIIESKLHSGTQFRIGNRELRVALLEDFSEDMPEKYLFREAKAVSPNDALSLDINFLIAGEIQNQYSLSNGQTLAAGAKENEIPLFGGGRNFLSLKQAKAICTLPQGYKGEVYNAQNTVIKTFENGTIPFAPNEKLRLLGPNTEVQIYWRTETLRLQRSRTDEDAATLHRSLKLSLALALLLLMGTHFLSKKTETLEELTTPKSSYFRLSTEASAPSAPAEEAAPSASTTTEETQPQKPQPSAATAAVGNVLNKLLQKKSAALSDESIAQAVSKNGQQSTRASNLAVNTGLQKQAIQEGGIGTGINAESVAKGLQQGSGGNGAGKNLNNFAKGGTGVGGLGIGNGKGGNGFNLNVGGEEAEAIGGLDKTLIAAVVQANLGQIKHCYETQLLINSNIYGKVVAEWVIDGAGSVSKSGIKKTTMNNSAVENCIASRIKTWKFPQPKGGGQVQVSYPFLFKSLN